MARYTREVTAALEYAHIDDESPVRGAYYWLIQNLDAYEPNFEDYVKTIWCLDFTVEEAVTICRAFGADI